MNKAACVFETTIVFDNVEVGTEIDQEAIAKYITEQLEQTRLSGAQLDWFKRPVRMSAITTSVIDSDVF